MRLNAASFKRHVRRGLAPHRTGPSKVRPCVLVVYSSIRRLSRLSRARPERRRKGLRDARKGQEEGQRRADPHGKSRLWLGEKAILQLLTAFDERFRSVRTDLHVLLLHLLVYYIVASASRARSVAVVSLGKALPSSGGPLPWSP